MMPEGGWAYKLFNQNMADDGISSSISINYSPSPDGPIQRSSLMEAGDHYKLQLYGNAAWEGGGKGCSKFKINTQSVRQTDRQVNRTVYSVHNIMQCVLRSDSSARMY